MFGITRALQIELGIYPTTNNFGATTRTQFEAQIGSISPSSDDRIIGLLDCALWCKGYYGGSFTLGWGPVHNTTVSLVRERLGLSSGLLTVNSKMMKSLLSMDSYTLLSGGSPAVRAGQQWLNGRYATRSDFYLSPTDGLYTRQLQQAIMYAIQYELGMADGVANGNLGPGTKSGLQASGTVQLGDTDTTKRFVRIFQLAMACNGYDVPQSGSFDTATRNAVLDFQQFMEITQSGKGDYGTWAALLVSTGDPDRAVTGMDTSTPLTTATAAARYGEGYRVVGRYLTVTGKAIVAGELPAIFGAGMKFFPILQNYNNAASYFTESLGRDHGRQAAIRARELGIGPTPIFFAVDYDATGEEASSIIIDYFEGIREGLKVSRRVDYQIGVYGTRNICSILANAGKADAIWVSGMSTGYSGNLGFPMPEGWWYNQIKEIYSPSLDRNAVSVRAHPLSSTLAIPTKNGDFHPVYWGKKTGTPTADGLMKLQVIAEDCVREWDIPGGEIANAESEIMLYWLRLNRYDNFAFNSYVPQIEAWTWANPSVLAKLEGARDDFYDIAGSNLALDPHYEGDFRHAAMTAHGVWTWGDHAGSSSTGEGDLGGWALDLVTLWAQWEDGPKSVPIGTFVSQSLEGSGSMFGFADLVADADGWVVGRGLRGDSQGLADEWRKHLALRTSMSARIAAFVDLRFGSYANTVSCVNHLFNSSFWDAPTIAAARALFGLTPSTRPSASELSALASAFASKLDDLSWVP